MKITIVYNVEFLETNHRILSTKKALKMYAQLKGNDKLLITLLTLRAIFHIKEEGGLEGEEIIREIRSSK